MESMKLNDHEQEVLGGVVMRLKTEFRAREVTLYGSAARGELDEASDIDLLAVMPVADWGTKKRVCDLCFEAELDIGRIISVHCISVDALEKTPIRSSPFIRNIRREGLPQ